MNNTLTEDDIQYVDASQPAPAVKPAAPDAPSATATNVDLVQDPYKGYGNGYVHSTETEPYLDKKGKVIHRDFWKQPTTKEEIDLYREKYDADNKLNDKELKKLFEDNTRTGESWTAARAFYSDALYELNRMLNASNGGVLDVQGLINKISSSPEYQMLLKEAPNSIISKLLIDIRNKGNKMNADIQLKGSSKYEEDTKLLKESIADTKSAVDSGNKATQLKVETTAKATQEKSDLNAAEIKELFNQKFEDMRVLQNALYTTYGNNPKLKGYNKDDSLNDARKETLAAKADLDKAAAAKDSRLYTKAMERYQIAAQKENAIASNVLKSDDYLLVAAEGMRNSNQITKVALSDTEKWLPKSILQAYLDGDFGKKTFIQEKDDNGNLRFDAEGNPIYKQKKIKKLDENGKQIFITKPVLDKNGNPLLDKDGNPRTYQEPQWEMANAEGYPSRAKQALGYYLLDTIGNMLTGVGAAAPGSKTVDTPSAWEKLQTAKSESYQNAINRANANAVVGSADTARGYSEDQRSMFKRLADEGFNLSALMARKQLDSSQMYELESLSNAGQYLKTMSPELKQALLDGMLMTADNIDEATAAILKTEWNRGPTGPLQRMYKLVTEAGGDAVTGLANGLTRIGTFLGWSKK